MNNEKDKRLDDLFKKKLEDPVDEPGYREGDWHALEQMLDKHKKRKGIIYWLPVISGIAALLLLFFGWWAFRPQADNSGNKPLAVKPHPHVNTGTSGGPAQQAINPKQSTPDTASYAAAQKSGTNNSAPNRGTPSTIGGGGNIAAPQVEVKGLTVVTQNEALLSGNITPIFNRVKVETNGQTVYQADLLKGIKPIGPPPADHDKIRVRTSSAFRPQYAVTVLAAPDVNGVGSFQQSKVGTNIGLMFSADVSKKLTISTGALYSVKPYVTGIANYHTLYQFPVDPVNVTADCRMLDIPLNIGYQVYNRHQNKLSFGTGLSSYIMLHESYKFNYASGYADGPASYTVPHSNGYFFGVLNLNATFEHKINSKVGIDVQPYVKLPLTNIGYSQVRLQTTGVAVGLHWNINSLSKP